MNNCKCSTIYQEGKFLDYADFEKCDDAIEEAIRSDAFKLISEPEWHKYPSSEMGAAGFLHCSECNGIWKMLIAERMQRGYWKRIK